MITLSWILLVYGIGTTGAYAFFFYEIRKNEPAFWDIMTFSALWPFILGITCWAMIEELTGIKWIGRK